jgi:hypothetical protein
MSNRSSRAPFAVALVLALFVLPTAGEAASASRVRLLPQTGSLRILERLERLENVLLRGLTSFWQKAGARIDDNGRS